ncbi:MAG TPA: DUF3565 domain-containing protein [Pseudomonas sp.]
MKQPISGYHRDDENHWVAELACGHNQHVRHNPPWVSRPWVTTAAGRERMLGYELQCRKCDAGAPPDRPQAPDGPDSAP